MSRRPDTEPRQFDDVTLKIGGAEVRVTGLLTRQIRIGAGAFASASVERSDLANTAVDYRGAAAASSGGKRVYVGNVIRATPIGEGVELEFDNALQLDETRSGHFVAANMPAPELIWSMAQLAGFPSGSLNITGLRGYDDEVFVAMPVEGIVVEAPLELGVVRIVNRSDLINAALNEFRDGEAKRQFADAQAWAFVGVQAPFLLPAESQAVARIEAALDRLALEAQYSLACAPDGAPLAFERAQLLTDPRARQLSLAWGTKTGRKWIRSLDAVPVTADMSARRLRLSPETLTTDEQFGRASAAWRRAVRTRDPVAAVGALFEAIEFYTAQIAVAPLFAPHDLEAIRAALGGVALTNDQRKRLEGIVGNANEPPLFVRLRAALGADAVPCTEDEIQVLHRLRTVRNRLTHGSAGVVDTDDLDLGRGLVNRMLCFRAWRAAQIERKAPDDLTVVSD